MSDDIGTKCANCDTYLPGHQPWCGDERNGGSTYPCSVCGCDMGVQKPAHHPNCTHHTSVVGFRPAEGILSSQAPDAAAPLPTFTVALLPGTEAYAADIKSFVDLMVWKLFKNRKKGYWGDADIEKYMQLLDGEYKELIEAIPSCNTAWIMEESADVANMALIIASTTMRKATVK